MPTIVFVEDEKDFLELICPAMERWGYKVIAIGEGLKAIDYISQNKPDMVLLDLGLPDVSGMKVLLETKKKYPDLTVWVASAHYADVDIREQAMQLKADDFLPKPLDPMILKTRLKEYFANKGAK